MVRIISEQPTRTVLPEFEIGQRNWDAPQHLAVGQLSMNTLFRTVALERGRNVQALLRADVQLDIAPVSFADPLRPGQFAWFDLERELLIVGFGAYPQQDGRLKMTVLNTLWQTVARSV